MRRNPCKEKYPCLKMFVTTRMPLMRRVQTFQDGVESTQNKLFFFSGWKGLHCPSILICSSYSLNKKLTTQLINPNNCNPATYKLHLIIFHWNGFGYYQLVTRDTLCQEYLSFPQLLHHSSEFPSLQESGVTPCLCADIIRHIQECAKCCWSALLQNPKKLMSDLHHCYA